MARSACLAAVADKDEHGRSWFAGLIERELDFAGVMRAASFGQLLQLLSHQPKITLVVVAADVPGFQGPKSIMKLRKQSPQARVVLLGDVTDRSTMIGLLAGGIHGVLSRRLPPGDMSAALRFVNAGHITIPSSLAEMEEWPTTADRREAAAARELTRRQTQILELLSKGLSNKLIARRLAIAPSTVKGHVQAAYRTLGVHDRREAAETYRG